MNIVPWLAVRGGIDKALEDICYVRICIHISINVYVDMYINIIYKYIYRYASQIKKTLQRGLNTYTYRDKWEKAASRIQQLGFKILGW
jgi:hypothetical protein